MEKLMSASQSTRSQQAREPLTLEAEAQQALDELWNEKAIPFKLDVGKLTKGMGEYTIHFYDSRMRTAHISLTGHESFKDMVRAAVLERVKKLERPLS
jgi:hypothetical protein